MNTLRKLTVRVTASVTVDDSLYNCASVAIHQALSDAVAATKWNSADSWEKNDLQNLDHPNSVRIRVRFSHWEGYSAWYKNVLAWAKAFIRSA